MLRAIIVSAGLFFLAAPAGWTQFGLGGNRIQGQVRINGQPAPQGVLVYLDRSRGRDASFVNGSGELGNTMTDSRGRFTFESFDTGQENPEGRVYVITVRYPGYYPTSQIIDLTGTPSGFISLDLKRDMSKSLPSVPPGGPGDAISAKQPSNTKAQEEWAKGQDFLARHDAKASIKNFKNVIELEPQYEPGYVYLGTAYIQTGQWPDAQNAFEKASKLDPHDAVALLGLGNAMNQQQNFNGALKPLQHSLELAESAEANYELVRILWALGKWAEAEPHARKALEINKEFAPAHVLMGNIFLRHRDANSALAEFREYLRLDSQGTFAASVKEMVAKIEKGLAQR